MSAYATALWEAEKKFVVEEALRQRDRAEKAESENAALKKEIEAKLEAVRELDPASAITALVTTYYADHHTDESWAALHDLTAEIRAILDGKEAGR